MALLIALGLVPAGEGWHRLAAVLPASLAQALPARAPGVGETDFTSANHEDFVCSYLFGLRWAFRRLALSRPLCLPAATNLLPAVLATAPITYGHIGLHSGVEPSAATEPTWAEKGCSCGQVLETAPERQAQLACFSVL